MPENPSEEQYIILCIPYRETFEEFLENSREYLREAWEKKRSKGSQEKNSWDKQEKIHIEDVIEFKRFWTKWEGKFKDPEMDCIVGPPTHWEMVAGVLGDAGFFSEESRGAPQKIKEQVLRIIKANHKAKRIDETSSNGKIVRLVQKDFQKKWPRTSLSKDSINRYVRLWKIQRKKPLKNHYKISTEDWLFLVKFDKVVAKNSLLKIIVLPLEEQWVGNVFPKLPKGTNSTWGDSEGEKLKEQVTSLVYAIDHSSGKEREKFGKLMNNIFQEQNTDEQILKIFQALLHLSDQPAL